MSIHRLDSELSRLNAQAAAEAVPTSQELFQVLATAQNISRRTRGSFDVTVRPLADLWGFIWKRDYQFPTDAELQAVLPRVNFELIELNAEQLTVRFRKPEVSIDLGGIGKGYAVDRAIDRLRSFGITNAMVKAGGDLRVSGAPPGAEFWTVQIEDPGKHGHRENVKLRDAALSTSGDYENFFVHEGRRYSHILDPRTGLPAQGVAACTVIASTCTESDAWATACFIYGVERSLAEFNPPLQMRFLLRGDAATKDFEIRQTADFPVMK